MNNQNLTELIDAEHTVLNAFQEVVQHYYQKEDDDSRESVMRATVSWCTGLPQRLKTYINKGIYDEFTPVSLPENNPGNPLPASPANLLEYAQQMTAHIEA